MFCFEGTFLFSEGTKNQVFSVRVSYGRENCFSSSYASIN